MPSVSSVDPNATFIATLVEAHYDHGPVGDNLECNTFHDLINNEALSADDILATIQRYGLDSAILPDSPYGIEQAELSLYNSAPPEDRELFEEGISKTFYLKLQGVTRELASNIPFIDPDKIDVFPPASASADHDSVEP